MSFLRRHYLFSTALFSQVIAVLISFVIIYCCTTQGVPPVDFAAAVYWSTIGVLGFAFLGMAIPLTVIVIAAMLILIMCGMSWKKVRFLSPFAFILWGVYWVSLAHLICSPPPD